MDANVMKEDEELAAATYAYYKTKISALTTSISAQRQDMERERDELRKKLEALLEKYQWPCIPFVGRDGESTFYVRMVKNTSRKQITPEFVEKAWDRLEYETMAQIRDELVKKKKEDEARHLSSIFERAIEKELGEVIRTDTCHADVSATAMVGLKKRLKDAEKEDSVPKLAADELEFCRRLHDINGDLRDLREKNGERFEDFKQIEAAEEGQNKELKKIEEFYGRLDDKDKFKSVNISFESVNNLDGKYFMRLKEKTITVEDTMRKKITRNMKFCRPAISSAISQVKIIKADTEFSEQSARKLLLDDAAKKTFVDKYRELMLAREEERVKELVDEYKAAHGDAEQNAETQRYISFDLPGQGRKRKVKE